MSRAADPQLMDMDGGFAPGGVSFFQALKVTPLVEVPFCLLPGNMSLGNILLNRIVDVSETDLGFLCHSLCFITEVGCLDCATESQILSCNLYTSE